MRHRSAALIQILDFQGLCGKMEVSYWPIREAFAFAQFEQNHP